MNPYKPSNANDHKRRKIRLFALQLVISLAAFAISFRSGFLGLRILNQKLGVFPTQSQLYEVSINGKTVPLEEMMWWSLSAGTLFAMIGFAFGALATLNYLRNKSIQVPF